VRRTLPDVRRTLPDVRRTLSDVRRTLPDVRRTLSDVRRTSFCAQAERFKGTVRERESGAWPVATPERIPRAARQPYAMAISFSPYSRSAMMPRLRQSSIRRLEAMIGSDSGV